MTARPQREITIMKKRIIASAIVAFALGLGFGFTPAQAQAADYTRWSLLQKVCIAQGRLNPEHKDADAETFNNWTEAQFAQRLRDCVENKIGGDKYVKAPPVRRVVEVPPPPVRVVEECVEFEISSPRELTLTFLVWGTSPKQPGCGLRYLGSCPEDCRHPQWGSPSGVYTVSGSRVLRVPRSMADQIRSSQLCAFGQGFGHINMDPGGWNAFRNGQASPALTFREDTNYRRMSQRDPSGERDYSGAVGRPFTMASVIPGFRGNDRQYDEPPRHSARRPASGNNMLGAVLNGAARGAVAIISPRPNYYVPPRPYYGQQPHYAPRPMYTQQPYYGGGPVYRGPVALIGQNRNAGYRGPRY